MWMMAMLWIQVTTGFHGQVVSKDCLCHVIGTKGAMAMILEADI